MKDLFTDFETLIVLDTETTGVKFRTDEIIELGIVPPVADWKKVNPNL